MAPDAEGLLLVGFCSAPCMRDNDELETAGLEAAELEITGLDDDLPRLAAGVGYTKVVETLTAAAWLGGVSGVDEEVGLVSGS